MKISNIPTIKDIEDYVENAGSDHVPTFGGKFEGGIQCQQVPDEIAPCIHAILKSGQPMKAYLEIGAAAGGTTFLMNHFLKPERIFLIDDNRHPKHHIRPYILNGVARVEIVGNSHDIGVIEKLSEPGLLFDVILIDGDHTYDGCKKDAEAYSEFLTPGGFLIFHDSVYHEHWGVHQVVEEFKAMPGFVLVGEYVTAKHSRKCGVALFRKEFDVDEDQ